MHGHEGLTEITKNQYHTSELRWGMHLERGVACTFVGGGVENEMNSRG